MGWPQQAETAASLSDFVGDPKRLDLTGSREAILSPCMKDVDL